MVLNLWMSPPPPPPPCRVLPEMCATGKIYEFKLHYNFFCYHEGGQEVGRLKGELKRMRLETEELKERRNTYEVHTLQSLESLHLSVSNDDISKKLSCACERIFILFFTYYKIHMNNDCIYC